MLDHSATIRRLERNVQRFLRVQGRPSLEEGSKLGPLISAAQRDRVLGLIEQGVKEGAEVIAGGPAKPALEKGYFVQPTILRVKPADTLAREEIFGPVLVVLTYRDEDEAVKIANDSIYGLGGGVWSTDAARAIAVARRMRTGQVDINGGHSMPTRRLAATSSPATAERTAFLVLKNSWSSNRCSSRHPERGGLL